MEKGKEYNGGIYSKIVWCREACGFGSCFECNFRHECALMAILSKGDKVKEYKVAADNSVRKWIKADEEVKHEVGGFYLLGSEDPYILCRCGIDTYCLVCLYDGDRWLGPRRLENLGDTQVLSDDQFALIVGVNQEWVKIENVLITGSITTQEGYRWQKQG